MSLTLLRVYWLCQPAIKQMLSVVHICEALCIMVYEGALTHRFAFCAVGTVPKLNYWHWSNFDQNSWIRKSKEKNIQRREDYFLLKKHNMLKVTPEHIARIIWNMKNMFITLRVSCAWVCLLFLLVYLFLSIILIYFYSYLVNSWWWHLAFEI